MLAWIICFVIGIAFVALEICVPGFGLLGLAGAGFSAAGVVLVWNMYGPAAGIIALAVCAVLTVLAVVFLLRSAVKGRLSHSELVLQEETAQREKTEIPEGKGIALTPLNPTGIVDFGGKHVQVRSEGMFIAKGTPVETVSPGVVRECTEKKGI